MLGGLLSFRILMIVLSLTLVAVTASIYLQAPPSETQELPLPCYGAF